MLYNNNIMPNQTITQYINSLTPSTLSVRRKPYTQSTIDQYKTVVRNALKLQNVDIDTREISEAPNAQVQNQIALCH